MTAQTGPERQAGESRPDHEAAESPRDAGVSLAELLVVIGIMSIIGLMVASMAVVVLRSYSGIEARIDNTTQSSQAMDAAGKVLRTAILPAQLETTVCSGCSSTALLTATRTKVVFYANIGNTSVGPSLVTLMVVADPANPGTGKLVQETQPPISLGSGQYTYCSRSNSSCVYRTRALGRGLLWPSPGVFTYYDYEGSAISESTVASANLPRVSSVDLVITVQRRPGDDDFPSRTAISRVRLPNVEINVLEASP